MKKSIMKLKIRKAPKNIRFGQKKGYIPGMEKLQKDIRVDIAVHDDEQFAIGLRYHRKNIINYLAPRFQGDTNLTEDMVADDVLSQVAAGRFDKDILMAVSDEDKPPQLENLVQDDQWVKTKALELLDSGDYDHPFGLMFLTSKLGEIAGGTSMSPKRVARLLPEEGREHYLRVDVSLEKILALREVLNEATPDELAVYGSDIGSYVLAKTVREKYGPGFSINLGHLRNMLGNKELVASLMSDKKAQQRLAKVQWDIGRFDLTLRNAERILNFLRQKYDMDADTFFGRYGTLEGAYMLAKDVDHKRDIKQIHSLVGNPRTLGHLLGIEDERLRTDWNPKCLFLDVKEVDRIAAHLAHRYQQNSEAFFELYGSRIGALVLAKELQVAGYQISPNRINHLIIHGNSLGRILGIEDRRFVSDWYPHTVLITMEVVEKVVDYLRKQYMKDPDWFFERYGHEMGTREIANDLSADMGVNIGPRNLHSLTSNGRVLASLLNIGDPRFLRWKHKQLAFSRTLEEEAIEILRESYQNDSDAFFEQYGSGIGMYLLARDLKAVDAATRNGTIPINDLCRSFGKSDRVAHTLGIEDGRFQYDWNPRNIFMDYDTLEKVLGVLRAEYQKSQSRFFQEYGSTAGAYHIAKKLEEEGLLDLHLLRIGTVVNKGYFLSELLGIEDGRFEDSWHPRELIFRLPDLERLLNFLRERYDDNPVAFFERYGAKKGISNLEHDLEVAKITTKRGKHVGYLSTILKDGRTLADLLGAQDERFERDWNNQTCGMIRSVTRDKITALLKQKYQQDPDTFFKRYGNRDGLLKIAQDTYDELGINIQLTELGICVANGQKVSTLLNVEDDRFDTRWNPKSIGNIQYMQAANILKFLTESYFQDKQAFFERYGSAMGVLNLAEDMAKSGEKISRLYGISNLVYSPDFMRSQINPDDSDFEVYWKCREMRASLSEARRMVRHLKKQYGADRDQFVALYTSKLRFNILAREMGMPKLPGLAKGQTYSKLQPFLTTPEALEAVLEVKDDRLRGNWYGGGKTQSVNDTLFKAGLWYLTQGIGLPDIGGPINDNVKEYLRFRYDVRGINRDVFLHYVSIVAPELHEQVARYVDRSIEADQRMLAELENVPGFVYHRISPHPARKYTKAQLIEMARKTGVQSSGQWKRREDLPSLMAIGYNFGTWRKFMDIVNSGEMDTSHEQVEMTYDEYQREVDNFVFKAGKLLYSFDSRIRLEAQSKLMRFGQPLLKRYLKKDAPFRDKAFDFFRRSTELYDPYAPFHDEESRLGSFQAYVRGNVKASIGVVLQQLRKSPEMSIERDGVQDEDMYGTTKSMLDTLI